MSTPALPAPGGNATAALAVANQGPDEIAINTGDTTTEGDMSYVDDDFDPFPRNDPRRSTPGDADHRVGLSQVNLHSMTSIDARTANFAIVNQGLDPGVAGQMMDAHQHAIRSEAGRGKLWWVKLEITSLP